MWELDYNLYSISSQVFDSQLIEAVIQKIKH